MTMPQFYTLVLCSTVLLVGVRAAEEVELPSSIKTCNHESADYSACLTQSIQDAWPTIVAEGIPSLNIPKLDPLEIDFIEHDYHVGSLKSHSVARNVKAVGLAKTTFEAIRANRTADRMSIEIDFASPKMFVEGYYKAETIMGSFKNGGKGYFNVTTEGTTATWILDGRIENDRWVLEHVRTRPDLIKMDNFKVYFDDMFNGNKELNKAALTFINASWKALMYTMPPVVYDIIDAEATELLNKMIFSKLSFSKTFP